MVVEAEPSIDELIERFERLEDACLPVPDDLLMEVKRHLRTLKWDKKEV